MITCSGGAVLVYLGLLGVSTVSRGVLVRQPQFVIFGVGGVTRSGHRVIMRACVEPE